MSDSIAFVSDVHGYLDALQAMIVELGRAGISEVVLLGDYINKGPDSAGVVEFLTASSDARPHLTPLAGNHELAFLECMKSGDVRPLLRMSGAPTIRSYTRGPVGADVFADLSRAVPLEHVRFLERLETEYSNGEVVARHQAYQPDHRYQVSAHAYVGRTPRISECAAEIDTGCGSGRGLLTALLWPSKTYVQVHEDGRLAN